MTDHQPIQEETREIMNSLAKTIDVLLNGNASKKWGFALLVFPFGPPNRDRMNYIGNGEREDVLVAIKELAARWEGRFQDDGGSVAN